ncbi:MAG: twin-arginine translocase TatA/TatE family subunit [Dehalococcoidia bacterium]|nr:twin-arginine translocase TatA/TatE family subunit [Dehalococcoidia bacterium]
MPRIGPTELIIVLVIILIIFGAGRLPEIGGAIGKGIRAFKRNSAGEDDGAGKGTASATETEKKTKV